MCDEVKAPCCEAINEAIGGYYLGLAEVVQRGTAALVENFENPVERAQRTGLALSTLSQLGELIREALSTLSKFKCHGECCSAAALAIRNAGIGFASNIIALSTNPLLPLEQTQGALNQIIEDFNQTLDVIFGTLRAKKHHKC